MVDSGKGAVELIEKLRALQKQQFQVRLGITVVVLAIFLVFGAMIYGLFTGFDQTAFSNELASKAGEALPRVSAQLGTMASSVLPKYMDEIERQSETRFPELAGQLNIELANLLKDAEGRLAEQGRLIESRAIASIEAALKRNPKLANDEKTREAVKNAIVLAFEAEADKAIRARFEAPAKELRGLLTVTADLAQQAKDDKTLKEQPEAEMVLALMTLMSKELATQQAQMRKTLKEGSIQ